MKTSPSSYKVGSREEAAKLLADELFAKQLFSTPTNKNKPKQHSNNK